MLYSCGMQIFQTTDKLIDALGQNPKQPSLSPIDTKTLASDLATTFVFTSDTALRELSEKKIWEIAMQKGIFTASIFNLYREIGENKITKPFTVPAINIRTLTFDTAQVIFKLMQTHTIGPVIFEIAKSEMGYTEQRPKEYATVIIAAALAANHKGPVFIQGDHFQLNVKSYKKDSAAEIKSIETLISESLAANFLQIDIDASTLVDLNLQHLNDQQHDNFEVTAHLTKFIRRHQPQDIEVAIGGEIGHIGGKNSTVEDFQAFMQGYTKLVSGNGISKVSVQTGSSHGGTPLPDGTIQKVSLDFSVLKNIGGVARERYSLSGAVQHGASTLPVELFDKFPTNNTVEIHLATGFQNTVYDNLPTGLHEEIDSWVENNLADERAKDQTREQFIYKSRKKAFGPFKKQLWLLRKEEKEPILNALSTQFDEIFQKLNITQTQDLIINYAR